MNSRKTFDYDKVPEHADELRGLARAIGEGTREVTKMGITIGQAFLKAKTRLKRGDFIEWREAETSYSQRSAQLYMNLTRLFFRLDEEERICLCALPLTAALELGRPSVEGGTVKDVLQRVRNGERLKVETVKNLLRRLKGSTPQKAGTDAQSAALGRMVKQALEAHCGRSLFDYLSANPRVNGRRFVNSFLEVFPKEETRDEEDAMRLFLRHAA